MLNGVINKYVSAANTNVPITVVFNTNDKISYNSANNTIQLNKPGYYEIKSSLTVTGVASTVTAQIFTDGEAVADAIASETLEATVDSASLSLVGAFKVTKDTYPNVANLSIQFATSGAIVNGTVIVEFVR